MKDWIELNSPVDIQLLSPAQLKPLIQKAWDAVPREWLLQLAHGMPDRLRRCIEVGGDDTGL